MAPRPVDWGTYRLWCERPDVASRFLLEESAGLLATLDEDDLAARLLAQCEGRPLLRPEDHLADARSDCFALDLSRAELERVVFLLRRAGKQGRCLPSGRSLAGVVEAWEERLRPLPSPAPGGALRLRTP